MSRQDSASRVEERDERAHDVARHVIDADFPPCLCRELRRHGRYEAMTPAREPWRAAGKPARPWR